MGANVTEVASSHVPMLSQPEIVIDVIRKAAAAVQKADRNRFTFPDTQERPSQGGLCSVFMGVCDGHFRSEAAVGLLRD